MREPIKSLCALLFCITTSLETLADVVLDGTISPWWGAISGPDHEIYNDYGHQVGGNLFYSFSQFDIYAGQSATFKVWTPPSVPIKNIISRVTAGSYSWIDGPLRSEISGANLYLLNPQGIAFGANASLDISGSFYASTANYLTLGAGGTFYVDPVFDSYNLLTTAPPEAFGFLADNLAGVWVNSWAEGGLQVPEGESISLVGGDIDILGGGLYAAHGRINLVSRAAAGEVVFTPDGVGMSPGEQGKITISEWGEVSTDGAGGGAIYIRSGQFEINDSTLTSSGEDLHGGVIDVTVQGKLAITAGEIIGRTDGDGQGSNIRLQVGSLEVRDGAKISTSTFASGQGGDLLVAADTIILDGDGATTLTGITAQTISGTGDAGNITIKTGSLEILDGAVISSDTFSSGQGGELLVAAESIYLADGKAEFTGISTGSAASGDAGSLIIDTGSLEVLDGAIISASTFASGQGGDLLVEADTIILSGDTATTFTGIAAQATSGTGNAGNLTIKTRSLEIRSGAEISASTYSSGHGGEIEIATKTLSMMNGGTINSSSTGTGSSGSIVIEASDEIRMTDSSISTETQQSDGGNITANAINMLYLVNSEITTSAQGGTGTGGNISIDPIHVVLNNSNIIANAFGGSGGNINIVAENFFQSPDSTVTASSQLGIDGNVQVDSLDTDISGSLSVLPSVFMDASALLHNRCAARDGANTSSLVMAGRGGLPLTPDGFMPGSLLDLMVMQGGLAMEQPGNGYLPPSLIPKPTLWIACL
ncbi:Putative hemagglutinin-related protein [hydrothermal vent metagenome]|uniref:Hemagglutinin-related protein n=1 Tax=hydrothermal vent metagenome TaxID=652676 RepID=A0A3B1B532_9ZZZZ